jgi:Sulfotransferase domain
MVRGKHANLGAFTPNSRNCHRYYVLLGERYTLKSRPLVADPLVMGRLSKAWKCSRWYRRLSGQHLPQVLIIGAQKCGTSALFTYLSRHPRLSPSLYKEVSFFGSDLRYKYGLPWYARQWDSKAPRRNIRFEASPQYLFAKQAPARIRECLPGVKLIAVLRDPVLRAYSAWNMYREQLAGDPQFYRNLVQTHYTPQEAAVFEQRTTAEIEDFELAVEREIRAIERGRTMEWSVVELGLYGPQLKRYLDLFPRENVLAIESVDLKLNRVDTLNRVLQFLGMPSWDWRAVDLQDVFVGRVAEPIPDRARKLLHDYFQKSNQLLADSLDEAPSFAVQETRLMAA